MKRIITCSDGTWNKPNSSDNGKSVRTNVQKIFDCILNRDQNGISQIKYYDEGIGAQGNFLVRAFNGATGKGIDDNIQDAYKIICWNYEPGDEIYLFGFSRGAYTVRCLAHLLELCGVPTTTAGAQTPLSLEPKNLRKAATEASSILYFWGLECMPNEDRTRKLEAFKAKHRCVTTVPYFIGVWDTVAAIGAAHVLTTKFAKHILELKYRYAMPAVFKELVEEFKLNPQAVSKYRLAAAVLGFAGQPQESKCLTS